MDENLEKKQEIRQEITEKFAALSDREKAVKTRGIENRVFEFANFLEAKVVLLYLAAENEVRTEGIFRRCFDYNKIVVLPVHDTDRRKIKIYKIDNPSTDLIFEDRRIPEPSPERCKVVPFDCLDIALVPALALDEKGGRVGSGHGYYDRLIPKLPATTRKVALAFEDQILQQVPMGSHDRHVDIIITDQRVIYKI